MGNIEKTHKFYHGTVTGKDDIYLESFIVTGAVSGKSRDPWDQKAGVYVCPDVRWPAIYARDRESPEIDWQGNVIAPLRTGRGMIVEIQASLDSKNWQIDHEMSWEDSIAVIDQMRDCLPSLPLTNIYDGLKTHPSAAIEKVRLTSVQMSGKGLEIAYVRGVPAEETQEKILIRSPGSHAGTRFEAYFLDKVHDLLAQTEPHRYAEENLNIMADMAANARGMLKYVGNQPLSVNAVYLRPQPMSEMNKKYEGSPPLNVWEKVFDFKNSDNAQSNNMAIKPSPTGSNYK